MKDRDAEDPVQSVHERDAPLAIQIARGIGTLLLVTTGVIGVGYVTALVVSWIY